MKTWTVTFTDGTVEHIQAETCTPTAHGELVFFVVTDGKPGLSRAIADGVWKRVDAVAPSLIL